MLTRNKRLWNVHVRCLYLDWMWTVEIHVIKHTSSCWDPFIFLWKGTCEFGVYNLPFLGGKDYVVCHTTLPSTPPPPRNFASTLVIHENELLCEFKYTWSLIMIYRSLMEITKTQFDNCMSVFRKTKDLLCDLRSSAGCTLCWYPIFIQRWCFYLWTVNKQLKN